MTQSVLQAIREGQWNYEPDFSQQQEFDSTPALPGSVEKVATLATRAETGLPLWHPQDRLSFDESEEALI